MKRDVGGLVRIEIAHEKAVSRSKMEIKRNTSLIELAVPIGVIRSLANVRAMPMARAARGSASGWKLVPPAPPILRRTEVALLIAILLLFTASLFVATF